jgi:hypothetical protein
MDNSHTIAFKFPITIWITIAALLLGGILAVSGLIISKRPQAKETLDKLVPFQGLIGVVLLAWGVIDLIRWLSNDLTGFLNFWALGGGILIVAVLSEIFLGFLLGMPMIAKQMPGTSTAERKAMEMQEKIAGFSVMLGGIGIAAAIGLLMIQLGIIDRGT